MLNFFLFRLRRDTKKRTKETRKVLCLQGLHGTPRARMREEKSGEVRPGLYEREREREYKIIWNYQIICDIFSVFLR